MTSSRLPPVSAALQPISVEGFLSISAEVSGGLGCHHELDDSDGPMVLHGKCGTAQRLAKNVDAGKSVQPDFLNGERFINLGHESSKNGIHARPPRLREHTSTNNPQAWNFRCRTAIAPPIAANSGLIESNLRRFAVFS